MSLVADLSVQRNLSTDVEPFALDSVVGRWKLTKFGESGERIIVAVFGAEPSGREGKEYDANAQNEGRDDLNEERETPRPFAGDVQSAVSCPESDNDSSHDAQLLKHEQGATNLGRRDFADVQWRDHTEHTYSKTSEEAGESKHSVVHSCSLQNSADDEDHHGGNNRVLSGQLVRDPSLVERTDQSTKLDHGGHEALVKSSAIADLREALQKLRHNQDDGDHTLVVTEEESALIMLAILSVPIEIRGLTKSGEEGA